MKSVEYSGAVIQGILQGRRVSQQELASEMQVTPSAISTRLKKITNSNIVDAFELGWAAGSVATRRTSRRKSA